jgi:hypothetical protein
MYLLSFVLIAYLFGEIQADPSGDATIAYPLVPLTSDNGRQDRILKAHNDIRANYGLPALKWSSDLQASAEAWASKCTAEHAPNDGSFGENLAMQGGQPSDVAPWATLASQVDSWKSEEEFWTCKDNSCSDVCGHLTQVIWKTTTEVGCGVADCPVGAVPDETFKGYKVQYMVCRYKEAGNVGFQDAAGNIIPEHPLDPVAGQSTFSGTCPTVPTPAISIAALHEEGTQTASNSGSGASNVVQLPMGVVGVGVVTALIVALVIVVVIAFIVVIKNGKREPTLL